MVAPRLAAWSDHSRKEHFMPRRIVPSLSSGRRTLVVGVVLATAALVGVGSSSANVKSATALGPGMVVNMATAPATLDPAEACGLTDLTVLDNTYMRLTRYGTKPGPAGTTQVDPGHIVPYFAKSWKITNGGKRYTFTLQPGVTFPSGKPVNSAAVKYSWQRTLTMGGCGGYFIYDGIYTPPLIKSMETPNPTTFVVNLSVPDPNVLQDWAQPAASVVDKSVVDAHGGVQKGKVNTWMSGHLAGVGPFSLKSYSPNTQAVLVANTSFFAPPKSKQITVNFISSDPTLLLQAKSGAADVTIGLSKQSVNSLTSDSKVKIVADDTSIAEWLGLPNNVAPFNNEKFREAMSYAVPYQDILSKIAYGYATLFYGPITVAMPEFNPAIEKARTEDLDKAKALIQASGVPTPVSVGLDVQAGNPTDSQIATIIQGSWAQLGVNVSINTLSPSDFINKLETHKSQAFLRYDGPGVIEAGYLLGYDMKCGVSFNLSDICIPAADKLYEQARKTTNNAKRQALWNQVSKLWIADSPKIPIYGDKATTVISTGVKSYYYSHEIDFSSWSK
jgi:peptide/nickel transport system substrate-binding protein